jgi:hypothetical protein
MNRDDRVFGYVFGGMCLVINTLKRSLSGYSLLE